MNAAKKMFTTVIAVQNLDTSSIEKAKEIFEEYKKKNIIIESCFDDLRWQFSDEYSNVGILFNPNELCYNRFYRELFGIDIKNFILYMKTYVMFLMGRNILNTIRDTINDIKRMLTFQPETLTDMEDFFLAGPNRLIDFITMLPCNNPENIEELISRIEELSEIQFKNGHGEQRQLASFDSYFLFNDLFQDFWNSDMEKKTRLFYYPLYLWWQVTAVIPLRPREFILTPRNCLEDRKDGTYLTLRRNKLKGGVRQVSYQIANDYVEVEYRITDKLAKEIKDYIAYTEEFAPTDLKTLFISDTHYEHWGQKKHSNSRYFTYINLNCVLRYFFKEVVEGIYGIKVNYERGQTHLKQGEIDYIYLGDTRHLALINIIAEGGTPVTAMLLAGHDNPEMAAHYYSNITNLIECRTYRQYRKVLKGSVSYNISPGRQFPVPMKKPVPLENGGKCYSEAYLNGKITDCMKAAGDNGEIGYCPSCRYFRETNRFFMEEDNRYKRRIEDDCSQLKEIIKQVRQGKGNKEDVFQVLLNLQNSSFTYQEYYNEKIKQLDDKGDLIWQGK